MNIPVQIILKKPPANVVFALQKGSGIPFETEQMQISAVNDLIFNFNIEVKGDNKNDEYPDFKGPFVQGKKTERFVYINIGTYAKHAESKWGRRLKVPLRDITWGMVNKINSNFLLQTIVPGTGKDGTPNCATVKPFDGWNIVNK